MTRKVDLMVCLILAACLVGRRYTRLFVPAEMTSSPS